jgi:hypothetical protein
VSLVAASGAGLEDGGLEHRSLELKGKAELMEVLVVR